MKSWKTYFSISPAIIKEDIRRLWAIPAIYFVVLFVSAVLPILFNYDVLEQNAYMIRNLLDNQNPGVLFVLLTMPIVLGCSTFLYMQKTASCTSMHALPMTRAKLFNSNALAAFIMTAVPMVLIGIILLLIAKPVMPSENYYGAALAINFFSRGAIISWTLECIVIMLFLMAISIFATIVTGNVVMSALASYGFAFLLPGLCLINIGLASVYLKGYIPETAGFEYIYRLNPIIKAMASDIGATGLAAYTIVSIAILVISDALYHKRKLERAGDSFVYSFLIPIISYIIGFAGLVMMGILFKSMYNTSDKLVIGYIIGGALFFVLGRIICLKTFRIMNKATLKNAVIFTIISCAVISVYAFDITGYEKRVPAAENVKYAVNNTVEMIVQNFDYNRFERADLYNWGSMPEMAALTNRVTRYGGYQEADNIEHVIALHNEIIEKAVDPYYEYERTMPIEMYDTDGAFYSDDDNGFGMESRWIRLGYLDNRGKVLGREYRVYLKDIVNNPHVKALYESKEFKNKYLISNAIDTGNTKIDYAVVTNNLTGEKAYIKTNVKELVNALDEDFKDRTYEEQIDVYENNIVQVNISMTNYREEYTYVEGVKKVESLELKPYNRELSFTIYETDTATRDWLESQGLGYILEKNVDKVIGFSGYKYSTGWKKTGHPHGEFYIENGDVTKEQLEYIVNNGRGKTFAGREYVEITLITSVDMTEEDLIKQRQQAEIYYEKYGFLDTEEYAAITQQYGGAITFLFPENDLPDFLKAL